MTFDEAVHEIDEAIIAARTEAAESALGLRLTLQFDGVAVAVFDHFYEAYEVEELKASKCACGNCGTIVVTYEADVDERVTLMMTRSATDAETVDLLEQWVR